MSTREKLSANIDAIELVLKLGKNTATPEQRQILQQYAGFGDLKCILLNPEHPHEFAVSEQHLIPHVQRLHDVIRSNVTENHYHQYIDALQESVLTSFYTPNEIIDALNKSFADNRLIFDSVLDPSAGLGAFTAIKGENYTLIEKDILTSKILKALHPDKKVLSYGYENSPARFNNSFNLVASNIPFGDFPVFDAAFANAKSPAMRQSAKAIHTYFFEKGLDSLRNGGILAFITSTGVMDSPSHQPIRTHLLSRARLITAVRLPENTFVSTKAQSDLIILQKDNRRTYDTPLSPMERKFIESRMLDNKVVINAMYADSDRHCMANFRRLDTDMYGKPDIRFVHDLGITGIAADIHRVISFDVGQQIDRRLYISNNQSIEAAKKPVQPSLFDDFFNNPNHEDIKPKTFEYANETYSMAGSYQSDGQNIGIAIDETTAEIVTAESENKAQVIRDYIDLRDIYFQLRNFENEFLRENINLRAELNKAYDKFTHTPYSVELQHPLSIRDAISLLATEPSITELKGLEIVRDGHATKADIFFEPVAFARRRKIYTSQEALYISRNRLNKVDLDYMQSLTVLSQTSIVNELKGQIYKNPETMQYETADIFLSGNVVEKHEQAVKACNENRMDFELKEARDALRNVIPEKIPFYDIGINLGERWIDTSYYNAFATSIFEGRTCVFYNAALDDYSVESLYNFMASKKYGVQTTNRYYGPDLVLRFALLDTIPQMTKSEGSGNQQRIVPDTEGITRMNATIELIKSEWNSWIQTLSADHKVRLEKIYNERFNCFVKPHFDGSFQTFPGLNLSGVSFNDLYQSQKDAILRIKCQNGGIIDHEVGGGKTMIMCCAAYEMKRLGIANKPVIVGIKANTNEISDTFRKIYPDAKILYADAKNYNEAKREDFFSQIQNNNWDCIIMTHEQFKKIPQSSEIQLEVLNEELDKIEKSLSALDDERVSFKRAKKALIKRQATVRANLMTVQFKLQQAKDKAIDFRTMGIDHIFCDESHKFKNLRVQTRHERVAGIGNTQGSERSMNMKFAIRDIQKRKGSDLCATFVSGTTIVNSLTELYVLFDYLRPQALEKQGIACFDAWASIYTRKSKEIEFGVTGELQLKERFREFVKVPELALFYSQITDFKTAAQIGIDRPEKNEMLITLEKTEAQHDMFERLKEFAKTGDGSIIFREKLTSDEVTAKMLIATNTAKKASLDMRLIDETRYDSGSSNRTQAVAEHAFVYYQRFNAQRGTQFIFCDLGTHKSDDAFSIYGDIKQKLMDKGVPGHQIIFIQDLKSDKQREQLFRDANAGNIRFMIGSTEMLGTGVNAQERCVAIHHVDIPWTPKDLEQRNGRGIRKGNRVAKLFADNKVDILTYATKESLDTYKFNIVANKAHFIQQIKQGSINVRTLDEGAMDEHSGMSYGEYVAILSGNTELLEKAKLEKEIAMYKSEERIFLERQHDCEINIKRYMTEIGQNEINLQYFHKDMNEFNALPRNEKNEVQAVMVVNDKVCNDYKSFGEQINRMLDKENRDIWHYQQIGSFADFKLLIKAEEIVTFGNKAYENHLYVQGHLKYQHNNGKVPRTDELAGLYPVKALQRIEKELIPRFEDKNKEIKMRIESFKSIDFFFPNKSKLEAVQARLAEIKRNLETKFGDGQEIQYSFNRSPVKRGIG